MKRAILLSIDNIKNNGGPFGCVIVKENEIVSKPIMYLALSYDHRIVDGKDSVSFLKCIKEYLEEPRRLFLQL